MGRLHQHPWRRRPGPAVLALAADADPAPESPRRFFVLIHAGLGLLVLTIALGALIGARYAATACPSLPGCGDVSWPAAAGWSALNPFATVAAATALGDDGGVALHLLHRYCALTTLLLLGIGSLQALMHGATRARAGLMLALLLVQFALGVLTVVSGFSLGLAVAHGACAAALLAATVQLLVRPAA
ncbi:MAG: COX15/CtaA family protein [Rhodocyclales bacterium]|nr:COX15/CtaA family protein [Rhodocyclales bacterium]